MVVKVDVIFAVAFDASFTEVVGVVADIVICDVVVGEVANIVVIISFVDGLFVTGSCINY